MNTSYELTPAVKGAFCSKMSEITAELRKSIYLSQTELGALAGISRQTISEIERGEYKMSWNQFCSLFLVFLVNNESCKIMNETGININELSLFLCISNNHTDENINSQEDFSQN